MSTVLITDDSRGMRMMIKIALQELSSVRLLEATDGRDALRQLHRESVDLITLDLNMPDMDGFDVVRAVRSDPDIKHIPIIMITSRADAPLRAVLLAEGVTHYLEKPFSPDGLIDLVQELLPVKIGDGT